MQVLQGILTHGVITGMRQTPSGKDWIESCTILSGDSFNNTYVTHLPITFSDHSPLIVQFSNREEELIKYFKFLNIWTEHPQFRETAKNVWDENHQGNPLWVLHQNLKRTASHLSSWSKNAYGDIHSATKTMETNIVILEQFFQEDNTLANRTNLNKAKAEYVQHLNIQEAILRQKARRGRC